MKALVRNAAWEFVKSNASNGTVSKDFSDAAKGLASLAMENTLFQAMATLHKKGGDSLNICNAIAGFLSGNSNGSFKDVQALFRDGSSVECMDMTDKAMEWIEWVKIFSAALETEDNE